MVERDKKSGESASAGLTDEWVPVELRESSILREKTVAGDWPVHGTVSHEQGDGSEQSNPEPTAEQDASESSAGNSEPLPETAEGRTDARVDVRLTRIEAQLGSLGSQLQNTAETVDALAGALQRSSEQSGERLSDVERVTDEARVHHGERIEALSECLQALEDALSSQESRLSDRLERSEQVVEEAARGSEKSIESLEGRLEAASGRLDSEAMSSREALDVLAENLGTRSGEANQRLVAIEQRVGELALELTTAREQSDEVAKKLKSGLERLEGHDGSEARLGTLERRVSESAAERADRLRSLERGLDELGVALERTRTSFSELENERYARLGRAIEESTAEWNGKLARMGEDLATQIEELRERDNLSLPTPLDRKSAPPIAAEIHAGSPAKGRQVPDGDTIAIPSQKALDVNLVTFEQLRGIGLSVTQASRLLDFRNAREHIASIDELAALPGFPAGIRDVIESQLRVDG